MTFTGRHVAIAGLLIAAAGCGESSGNGTNPSTLTVTASVTNAIADGTSTVAIHVAGTAKGPIQLSTNRGMFAGGAKSLNFDATPFDATLHSCNFGVDATCAGTTVVEAVDANLETGSVALTFTAPGGVVGGTDGGTDGGSDGGTDGGTDGGSGAGNAVLGQIALAAKQSPQFFPILGVRYSGFQETSFITFQLFDTEGRPYPAGLTVDFEHVRLNGSYIGLDPATACSAGPPPSCTATGTTDANGQVTVPLSSGLTAGVVAITATATGGGNTVTFTMGNLAIVGAKPSGAHITVDCVPNNVPALSSFTTPQDCSFSHYQGPDDQVTCNATLADRFGNVLGVATAVAFYSEAGNAGPPVFTPAYGEANAGTAAGFIDVYNGKLPWDVTAFDGEYSLKYSNKCGDLTHNPRDGLVTVIAMAYGEEGFVDVNGNGIYDGPNSPALAGTAYAAWAATGEPFIDMGEPYIDANDNGQWDPGEPYFDANTNGKYDGPNGKWDANTVIWAETRILYTDYASAWAVGGLNGFSRYWTVGAPPTPTAQPTFSVKGTVTGPTSQDIDVVFMDGNFNRPSHLTTFAVASEYSFVTAKLPFAAPDQFDYIGMTFTQQYCDSPKDPTICSNVCPTAPCYVVTNVGNCSIAGGVHSGCDGFEYGNSGTVRITGACSKAVVNDVVDAQASLNGVDTVVEIGGTCTP